MKKKFSLIDILEAFTAGYFLAITVAYLFHKYCAN